MFAESLLESAGGRRTNQRWTALASLSLEAAVIGVLILLPLLENQGFPRALWISSPTTTVPPPRGVPNPGHNAGGHRSPDAISLVLLPPSSIPRITDLTADGQSPNSDGTGPDMPLGLPNGMDHSTGPLLDPPGAPPRPTAPSAPPHPSFVSEANVVYRVLPVYPPIARQIGAQGPVVLRAVIARDGTVDSLRVVSSAHPALNQAALEAVSQWRFRPYLLNGVAVEVEAQITVNFILPR